MSFGSDIKHHVEETVEYARALAKRIGEELNIPVYCYENAAFTPERKNLATCRAGEYEALGERLSSEQWHPDFGPRELNEWTLKPELLPWEPAISW